MGFLNKIFRHSSETSDEKELREYEEAHILTSDTSDTARAEFIIEDTFALMDGKNTVVVGTVTSGTFKKGDKVMIIDASGNEIKSVILDIEVFMKKAYEVSKGSKAGFMLKDIQKDQIQKNDVIKKYA